MFVIIHYNYKDSPVLINYVKTYSKTSNEKYFIYFIKYTPA